MRRDYVSLRIYASVLLVFGVLSIAIGVLLLVLAFNDHSEMIVPAITLFLGGVPMLVAGEAVLAFRDMAVAAVRTEQHLRTLTAASLKTHELLTEQCQYLSDIATSSPRPSR